MRCAFSLFDTILFQEVNTHYIKKKKKLCIKFMRWQYCLQTIHWILIFDLKDQERSGRSSVVCNERMAKLIRNKPSHTTDGSQFKRKKMVMKCISIWLNAIKNNTFFKRTITGDEKWFVYNNSE